MIHKKALMSLLVIGLVGLAAGVGTFAYFSNTEKATENTLTAGTIDIAVNGQNPWNVSERYNLTDMKPCETTKYINVTIENVGTNPAKIYKLVNVTGCDTGLERYQAIDGKNYSSEPEYTKEQQLGERVDDIHNVTDYSLKVTIGVNETELQTLGDGVTVGDIEGTWIELGVLQPGEIMEVSQDYHLLEDAGNEYQGDSFTFDITFGAAQLNDETTFMPQP